MTLTYGWINFLSQYIIDCIGVEPYNICAKYIVNPCISVSTIPYLTNIDVQNQIMHTHEFHSLLQNMKNEERFILYDVMYRKKQNPNEPIHLFITRVVGTCKFFTLMLLIQALIRFYNRHPHSDPLKKNVLFMAYIGKTTFNIDGTTIHSSISIPLNYKNLPSLSSN
jgi:hypothetical protein